jgi:hypothetical protein
MFKDAFYIFGMCSMISMLTLEIPKEFFIFKQDELGSKTWPSCQFPISYFDVIVVIQIVTTIRKRKFTIRDREMVVQEAL